jgi:Prokaryotic N-terminal methylation motif
LKRGHWPGVRRMQSGNRADSGFSVLEALISLAILVVLLVAAYSVLDQTRGTYLRNEGRIALHQIGMTTLEMLERDLRAAGFGIPTGVDVTGRGDRWTPAIWAAGPDFIYFRADVDGETSLLTRDLHADDVRLYLEHPMAVAGDPLPLLLTRNGTAWESVSAVALADDEDGVPHLQLLSAAVSPFTVSGSLATTPEHVFYRFVPAGEYPFGTVERLIVKSNVPLNEIPEGSQFIPIADHVTSLQFQYFTESGARITDPAAQLSDIARIVISIVCRERAGRPGEYQSVRLETEVLLRNREKR